MKRGQKVYLAARYIRRKKMKKYAKELMMRGYYITSSWIWGSHEIPKGISSEEIDCQNSMFAVEGFIDLRKSDVVINFTEEPRATKSRGGRHVEFGMALAWEKEIVIIGPQENLFHHLIPDYYKEYIHKDYYTEAENNYKSIDYMYETWEDFAYDRLDIAYPKKRIKIS